MDFDFGIKVTEGSISFDCPKCDTEVFLGVGLSDRGVADGIKLHMETFHGEDISVRRKGTERWM